MTLRQKASIRRNAWHRLLPVFATFAATLISAPGHAVTIPAVPLQSGSAYPPANIRFILDDSGSMAFVSMPKDVSDPDATSYQGTQVGLNNNPTDRSYLNNTIYYNPNNTYKPWIKSDGTRYAAVTDVTCLTNSTTSPTGGSCRDLRDTDEGVFYIPKSGVTNSTNPNDFNKYWVRNNGGTAQMVTSSSSVINTWVQTIPEGGWVYQSISVSAGTDQLVIQISGNSNNRGNADLYVKRTANPTTGSYDYADTGSGSTESVTINSPQSGTWHIGVYDSDTGSGNRDVTGNTLTVTAYSTVAATPTGRTQTAELQNIATWYTYSRTRSKVAKSGAGEAFFSMGPSVRVGFDTIWNRNEFAIPVGTNNGVFSGTNRDTWYSRLYAATASNGTPLHGALRRAGEAFKDTSASGPWGPETGANQLSCRQNFSILTTDGYWNDFTGYGSAQKVGDTDGTAGPTNTDPKGGTWTYAVANPYKDNFTTSPNTQPDTLADVAMAYWKNDLVSGLTNNVPTSTADPAFWQHMVTFGVSIGLQGRLNPKTDLGGLSNGTLHWGDPTDREDLDRIDDLWHASVNSRGSFVTASNPTEFTQGLLDALKTVAARLGSASNVTSNSTSFSSDTRVYQASYVSGKWTGELSAYNATAAGVSASPAWTAAGQITATGRKVFTWNSATSAGATFPTAAQITALDQSSRSLSPVNGTDNAAYIKGDKTKEGSDFGDLRARDTLLGDIVDSSPMYVKDTDTLFVGANDGMLHAFNAATGAEYFAYVPGGASMADLATLSDPQYVHRYFVDGPVVVSTQSQTPSHNYLVGALGRGGKGIFGLDVTTPGSFGTSGVLWEKTTGNDMGYVLGEPLIVTLNDGNSTKAVIVGNGINSTNGHAVLFVYNLATGALISTLDTGVGGDNGMSAPRGWDDNGDGTVDYVYAGDLKGNLWKFDFTGTTASIALGGTPLFTAASGQPISAGLGLARDAATGKRWIFAGTGKFLESGDVNDYTVQSIYGIMDDAVTTTLHRSDLQARSIIMTSTVDGKDVRGFEVNGPLNNGVKGWYIDLNKPTVAGERVTSRPQIKGSVLVVASIIPPTNNSCEAGGAGYISALDAFTGSSTTAPYFDANGDGKVDAADTLSQNGTTVPVGSIDLGVGMPTLPTVIDKLLVVGGSTGGLGDITVNPQGGAAQRISWREILGD